MITTSSRVNTIFFRSTLRSKIHKNNVLRGSSEMLFGKQPSYRLLSHQTQEASQVQLHFQWVVAVKISKQFFGA